MIFFVRSALCMNKDDKAEAIEKIHVVLEDFLHQNALQTKHIKSILFTQTGDLKLFNVAQCLREKKGYENMALFTMQEVICEKALEKTIRLLIVGEKFFMFKKPRPIYKFGAEKLRPDIFFP